MVIKWAIKTKKVRFLAKIQTNLISYSCDQELYFSFQNFNDILEVLFGNNSMYNKVGRVVTMWSNSGQVWHKVWLFLARICRTLLSYSPGVTRNLNFSFKDLNGMIVMLIINNVMYTKVAWIVMKWPSCGQLRHKIWILG